MEHAETIEQSVAVLRAHPPLPTLLSASAPTETASTGGRPYPRAGASLAVVFGVAAARGRNVAPEAETQGAARGLRCWGSLLPM